MSLARRSITSAVWNISSSVGKLGILFARTVFLARILPVDSFGAYAFATSIVRLTLVIPNFGMRGAFIHRTAETEDLEQTASVHFTLKLMLTFAWAAVLTIVAFVFTTGPLRYALLVLTFSMGGLQLMQTPKLLLTRRVDHRRLAVIDMINSVLTTIVAVGLALRGYSLTALLATDIASLFLQFLLLYIWRPVWRPKLSWSPPIVRYFLRFGSRGFLADILQRSLDRVDDLWTGFFLGATSLGFYSRAYTFATYPRMLLASPLNNVAGGTYAELKGDRLRLSQAFFRTNAFLIRTGFLLAGLLALVAPEFIRILLTPKWLPMLDAFRLMLVFTLLDPIKVTIGNLFIAVGKPEQVAKARVFQLVVMVILLFALGFRYDIAGVALAVNIMVFVGIGLLLWRAREYVDFSAKQMFLVPTISLVFGLALARLSVEIPNIIGSPWRSGAIKAFVFCAVYGGILLVLERNQTMRMVNSIRHLRPGIEEGELR